MANMAKLMEKRWTAFQQATIDRPEEQAQIALAELAHGRRMVGCWVNSICKVFAWQWEGSPYLQLSISRHDAKPIHDWRQIQRAKNETIGPEVDAVELYPAESRRLDTQNVYHLWCAPPGTTFPFGFSERKVHDHPVGQRKLETP